MARNHTDPLDLPDDDLEAGDVPFETGEESQDEDLDPEALLAQASALAAEAAKYASSDKAQARRKIKELEKLLSGITLDQVPDLAESPVLQKLVAMIAPRDMRPGETRHAGTLAEVSRQWTLQDVLNEFPMKDLVPMHSMTLTFNDVEWGITAGEPCRLPECFWYIYMQYLHALRQGERHVNYMLNPNAPPPDRNWLTPESQTVRATTQLGNGRRGVGPLTNEESES